MFGLGGEGFSPRGGHGGRAHDDRSGLQGGGQATVAESGLGGLVRVQDDDQRDIGAAGGVGGVAGWGEAVDGEGVRPNVITAHGESSFEQAARHA